MSDSCIDSQKAKGVRSAASQSNRLAGETSPYLLQHACNPVDWYPWGKDAINRSREENKPIFLSIGYSACHWCHVMERESFEDAETARILDRHFIAIKVDREERPDLDDIYMTAVMMMTGRGGWPLSLFLTPDLEPFFGGTYFPPDDHLGMPGFKNVLLRVATVWREHPDAVAGNAEQMVRALQANATSKPSRSCTPDVSVLSRAVSELRQDYDKTWGGFGNAPKFPPSDAIALLLRHHLHTRDDGPLEMATGTLDRMARGGMYDQLGGGFHRYSVDAQWLVPHFEKMLYDNALLSRVYLEAWQATGKVLYRDVAAGILDYVLRDMTDCRGGFFSAEDADSEGEEGKYYVWQPAEIKSVLGAEDGELFCQYYGVTDAGNFEGNSILNVPRDPATFADDCGVSKQELEDRLIPWRQKLLAVRSGRVRPDKDDKVLAAWNGMMISAFARGYQVLGHERYRNAAWRAADFVLSEMVRDGVLLRTYRGASGPEGRGISKLPGYLDDYAEMANALIDLYEASFERRWLEAADQLVRKMTADFWDAEQLGFFYTAAVHQDLLVRTKPFYDGAVPSGNSTATLVLLRLSKLLGNQDYREKAELTLQSMADKLSAQPRAYLNMLCVLDFCLRPAKEIAIVGKIDNSDTGRFLDIIHGRFLPNKILALARPNAIDAGGTDKLVPLLSDKCMIEGKTAVYVCEDFTCQQPITDPDSLENLLDSSDREATKD